MQIRDFPDHTTFREMGAKLACADKLGVFLSLTYVIRPTLTPYIESNMMALKKCESRKKCMNCTLSPDINDLMMLVCLIFKNIIEN